MDARALYAAQISMISDDKLIYFDETGLNLHTSRSYGYSQINTKAHINVPANRNVNSSLLCMIGVESILAYEYNALTFINFIKKMILYFNLNHNKILIMDNARFYKTAPTINLFIQNNISVKYLIPYSPELNSIEEFSNP